MIYTSQLLQSFWVAATYILDIKSEALFKYVLFLELVQKWIVMHFKCYSTIWTNHFTSCRLVFTVQNGSLMMITFRQKRGGIFFYHPAQCPLVEEDMSCALPKIFMISARSVQQRKKAFNSWASHDVIVYDTTGKFHQNLRLLSFSLH